MDFEFNDEQRLLKDSVENMLADHYGFEARRAYMQTSDGWSRDLWRRYAELGLLGLPFDERYGGSGGGRIETMIVAEAFGRSTTLEPFFSTVVLAGGLLRLGGNDDQRTALLPKIADGSMLMAFAHSERQARYDLADVATTALREGDQWILNGDKSVVLHGDSAEQIIVSARVSGKRNDRDGIGLFLVDANASGLSRRAYQTIDGQRAADLSLSDVKLPSQAVLSKPGAALNLIEWVVDQGIAALCAEAVGAMAKMHELTVEYLRTRRQFGVPIGNFQVLQHRCVDMLIALEQARSMAMLATMMADEANAPERHQTIAAAKVQIGRSAHFIGQQAVQLHGGIGMTMEYQVGHFFKRVTAIDKLFGDADHHLSTLSRHHGLISSE